MWPIDPAIHYLPIVPDWRPEEATLLAGFAPQLCGSAFLLEAIGGLPADVFEPAAKRREVFVGWRMSGFASLRVHPQSPRSAMALPVPPELPFTVIILGPGQDVAPFQAWGEASRGPITLVAEKSGDLGYQDLTLEGLQKRFLEVCALLEGKSDPNQLATVRAAIEAWAPRPERDLPYRLGGHASIAPNIHVLRALGFRDPVEGPFKTINRGVGPYVEQIVQTARSVLDERTAAPATGIDTRFPRRPVINLFAPAMFAKLPFRMRDDAPISERRNFQLVKNQLDRQEGYSFEHRTDAQFKAAMGRDPKQLQAGVGLQPHFLLQIRQKELALATSAISVLAASELSAVLRLPNSVNRSRGAVRQFAAHCRSHAARPLRAAENFSQVQRRLAEYVPADFLRLIRETPGDIRIVADAHLEWLDLDGLPLGLRRNVSRIPATPGNLFVEQVMPRDILHLSTDDLHEILVVGALKRDDPIRPFFDLAMKQFGRHWEDRVRLRFVEVGSAAELRSVRA